MTTIEERAELAEDRRAERAARIAGSIAPLPNVRPPKNPEPRAQPKPPKALGVHGPPRPLGRPRRSPPPATRELSPVGLSMPRPRQARPQPQGPFIPKEYRLCCAAARDDLGRYPIGFCGPHCIGRLQRDGLL